MTITNYTQNFIKFMSNHSFTTETTNTIFDPVSEEKMGKYLRFTDDNGDITLLNFDHNIREAKSTERVNNRKCLSDYLYKGKDFAKNVLLDNGFFVPDDDLYESLKSQWGFFKYRVYNPVKYNNGNIGYFRKETFYKYLKKIEDSAEFNTQAKNACSEWRNKTRTVKNNNGSYTTYHETLEDIGSFYYQPKYNSEHYNFGDYFFGLIGIEVISFFVLALMHIDSSVAGPILLLVVPIGLLLCFQFFRSEQKQDNAREQRRFQESQKAIDDLMNQCDNESKNEIKEIETNLCECMKKASEDNKPVEIAYDQLSGSPNFDIDSFNCLYNLLMHCAYPYTFDSGEIFNPVYTVSYNSYIESIDRCFQMIDEYLDYCSEFVYPMIRAYGRKSNIDLRDLNTYIIEERRVDKRHKEICAKLDRIYYGLQQLHKDNLRILDSLNNISSELNSIANYQAITSAQLAAIERKI